MHSDGKIDLKSGNKQSTMELSQNQVGHLPTHMCALCLQNQLNQSHCVVDFSNFSTRDADDNHATTAGNWKFKHTPRNSPWSKGWRGGCENDRSQAVAEWLASTFCVQMTLSSGAQTTW